MAARPIAIIAGIGPGTGASVARKFAASYPVALLARTPESYNPLVDEINKSGGTAFGVSADVSDSNSIKKAFEEIKAKHGGDNAQCAAAVFNASGAFYRKPFLELTEDQFMSGLDVSAYVPYAQFVSCSADRRTIVVGHFSSREPLCRSCCKQPKIRLSIHQP